MPVETTKAEWWQSVREARPPRTPIFCVKGEYTSDMTKIAEEIEETWLEPVFRREANADHQDTVDKFMQEFGPHIPHAACPVPKHN